MDGPEHSANDLEVLKKMEDEHFRLQRQVRMIQTDRQNRCMGVHPLFRRQDELLSTLQLDYKSLSKDLKIARSGAHKKKDKKMKKDLKNALNFRVHTSQQCEAGIIVTGQIEGLAAKSAKDTAELRKIALAARGQLVERRMQSEHRLVSTENKLETAQLRVNMVQHENNKIREEIEHMMKDRALFNQSWNKMLTALSTGKKFLADLFESSTLAYDQRDEWVAKLKSIQEKGKIDQMLQIQEMRDLIKAYNHELKLFHFLAAKGVTRINEKQDLKEEEDKKRQEDQVMEDYRNYLQILEDVFTYTDKITTKGIIEQFRWWEQQIDSIFNLMIEYCAQNEILRRDVQQLHQEIIDRRDFIDSLEDKCQKRLANLSSVLEQTKSRKEELSRKNEGTEQILKTRMNQVNDIFNMLGCSLEPFANLLGDKGPSIHQMKLSLLLITEKIKEYKELIYFNERYILQGTKYIAKRGARLAKYTVRSEKPSPFTTPTINMLVPANPCPACVESRWFSRICEGIQPPLNKLQTLQALSDLTKDPAYMRSDRIHPLSDCKVPRSRALLARRYMNF